MTSTRIPSYAPAVLHRSLSALVVSFILVAGAAQAGGKKTNGEPCVYDAECTSRECSGIPFFTKRCVERDHQKHPLLPSGASCRFDGDCGSLICRGRVCR